MGCAACGEHRQRVAPRSEMWVICFAVEKPAREIRVAISRPEIVALRCGETYRKARDAFSMSFERSGTTGRAQSETCLQRKKTLKVEEYHTGMCAKSQSVSRNAEKVRGINKK